MKTKPSSNVSISNIYKLNGQVPLGKAIPFGIQHILAMFVSNLTPIILIGTASGLDQAKTALLLQNAMFIAGIATLIQLYPVWRIGSGLPIVMGVSFTFVTILTYVGGTYGYGAVVGAVLIGGIMEGTLGLLAKYWRKIITPVVAAAVVTTIGYSLLTVGIRSFGGGYTEDFGSPKNLILGTVTLVACLLLIFCKILLETVICSFWISSWLYSGICYGNGLIFCRYSGRRIYSTSFSSACYAGISCRRYCFGCHYFPGICCGNHWRHLSALCHWSGTRSK